MKILFATVSALALIAASPVEAGDWTGPYIGIHGGYTSGSWDGNLGYSDPAFPGVSAKDAFDKTGHSLDAGGGFGGVQGGYNLQFDRVVVGIEADGSWGEISDSGTYFDKSDYMSWTIENELQSFGTIRTRAGLLATPALLLYATAGVAWGNVESHEVVAYPGLIGAKASSSDTLWGWTAGAGAEFKLNEHWSLNAQYLYVDLGHSDNNFVGTNYVTSPASAHTTDSFANDLTFHTIRAAVNYKF